MFHRLAVHDCAQGRVADARIPGEHCADLGCEMPTELLSDKVPYDDPFRGHTDLTLIHEGAECRSLDGLIHVGIIEHNQGCFAPELQQARLQMLGGTLCDDLAHRRGAGKVDSPDRRMIDQRSDYLGCVLGAVGHYIHDAFGEPCGGECLTDQLMCPWTCLRG